MTSGKFEELLNLYLDKAITPTELNLLKKEISENSERFELFEQYCCLHQASRLVLKKRHHSLLPYVGLIAACIVGMGSFIALNPWGAEGQLKAQQTVSATPQKNVTKVMREKNLFKVDSLLENPADFYLTLNPEPYRPWNNGLEYEIPSEFNMPTLLRQAERNALSSERTNPNQGLWSFDSRLVRLPER